MRLITSQLIIIGSIDTDFTSSKHFVIFAWFITVTLYEVNTY